MTKGEPFRIKRTTPTQEEIVDFIQDVARHRAMDRTAANRSVERRGKTLTVRIEGREDTFRKMPDGTIARETGPPGKPMSRSNILDHAQQTSMNETAWEIQKQVDNFVDPEHRHSRTRRNTEDEDALEILEMSERMESKETRAAIEKATMEIARELGFEGRDGKKALADPALRKFLGAGNIRKTLAIAGKDPGLLEFNRVVGNAEAITELHRETPNAALVWTRRKDRHKDRKTPDEMTEQARVAFMTNAPWDTYHVERGGRMVLGSTWETFLHLEPGPIGQHPLETNGHMMASVLATEAGAFPSAPALELLITFWRRCWKLPRAFTLALIQESAGARANQKRLTAQFRAALRRPNLVPPRTPGGGGWREWMEQAGPAIENAGSRGPRKPGGPGGSPDGGSPDREPGQDRSTGTREEIQRITDTLAPAGTEARRRAELIARDGVRVAITRAKVSLTVQDPRDGSREALALTRFPSGAIRLNAPEVWTGNRTILFGKDEEDMWRDGYETGRWRNGLRTGVFGETTCVRMIAELLREEWERAETAPVPDRSTLTGAAWKIINELPPEGRAGADDRRLSEQLDAGILAILDPGVLRKMGNKTRAGRKTGMVGPARRGQVHHPRPVQPRRRPGGNPRGAGKDEPRSAGVGLPLRQDARGDPAPRAGHRGSPPEHGRTRDGCRELEIRRSPADGRCLERTGRTEAAAGRHHVGRDGPGRDDAGRRARPALLRGNSQERDRARVGKGRGESTEHRDGGNPGAPGGGGGGRGKTP